MKSLLCCVAAFAAGAFLLEQESLSTDIAGMFIVAALLIWPTWSFSCWLIPLPEEDE